MDCQPAALHLVIRAAQLHNHRAGPVRFEIRELEITLTGIVKDTDGWVQRHRAEDAGAVGEFGRNEGELGGAAEADEISLHGRVEAGVRRFGIRYSV